MGSSGSSAQCPSDGAFAALIDGRLEPAAVAELNQHVGTCSACATLLEQVRDQASRTSPAPLRPRDDQLVDALLGDGSDLRTQPAYREALLDWGGSIGRYLVSPCWARGGMGEVYAADDPYLDCRVALKLLRLSRDTEGARERMLREARALGEALPPQCGADLRRRRARGTCTWPWSWSRAGASTLLLLHCCLPLGRTSSRPTWRPPADWRPPTIKGSSIGTSSPPMSFAATTATPASPTSGWWVADQAAHPARLR